MIMITSIHDYDEDGVNWNRVRYVDEDNDDTHDDDVAVKNDDDDDDDDDVSGNADDAHDDDDDADEIDDVDGHGHGADDDRGGDIDDGIDNTVVNVMVGVLRMMMLVLW